MTNPPTDFNKVVDLQTHQATQAFSGGGDRLGELLRGVRATALKRLQGLVSTLFENIDDALFDLAEKAENNAVQTVYFDGMRKVRLKRQVVERLFQEQLGKIFNDFAAGRLQPAKIEGVAGGTTGELSLVDETELEENLAISSTVTKAENRLAPQLNALNQRLSLLRGGANVEDALNPLGPGHLSQAFRSAMRELELSVNSRLIIFKLFDRYVMSNLGSVYDEVNEQLIQAGVLPQIRYALPPGAKHVPGQPLPPGAPAPADAGMEGMVAQAYAQAYDPASAHLQIELYNTVRSLMASRRQFMLNDPNYVAAPLGAPSVPITELLSALTLLQTSSPIAQSPVPTSGGDAAQFVQQVKRELLDQAGKFHGGDQVGVAAPDEDTIDLVGMLFEYILRDRNLPVQMQAVLGRLQIPYLKVALLDKHLFAQKAHPARQLLDVMAQASMGWSEESDRDRRLYDKVNETVEKILKNFDEDLAVFDTARTEFETFLDSNKKRAELAEQRAAEATRGREKLHAARRTAAREILKRVENRHLPEIVHNVLTRPWANFLVLTLLRQGEDSNEWRQALRFADEFAWSAEPKPGEVEKTRLKSILPVLEKSLRHGLATVAYHENDVKQLMQELNNFYRGVLATTDSTPVIAAAEAASPLASAAGKAAATAAALDSPVEEEIQLREEDARAPQHTLGDEEECLRQARDMKVGMWVEFTDANGTKERAKLSWISPISSKYLFVNRKGLKVSDMTAPLLAQQIKDGKAVVLEEVPLFDRALDAIVERLKQAHAATAAAAPTSA
jgi:hypothetical protein